MASKKKVTKKKAAKKKTAKRIQVAMSAEDLVAGLRRNRGRLPTKASESAFKRRQKKKKSTKNG